MGDELHGVLDAAQSGAGWALESLYRNLAHRKSETGVAYFHLDARRLQAADPEPATQAR